MTQQEIVLTETRTLLRVHAVVPHAVAKQQQVRRHVGLCLCAVVEHLQIAAVCVGVGRTARKFVIQFVGRHYAHPHAVFLLVQFLYALRLSRKSGRGGHYDNHVGSLVGMMILVGYVIHIFGHAELTSAQRGARARLVLRYADIVEPCRTARYGGYRNRVRRRRVGVAVGHVDRLAVVIFAECHAERARV